ncbi:MAG: hypothetical protein LBJ18_00050 [Rickettsiales bacterium]|jgi:hypothetical protein|nr:hypothetical protein [Rickettsiales bacterium]
MYNMDIDLVSSLNDGYKQNFAYNTQTLGGHPIMLRDMKIGQHSWTYLFHQYIQQVGQTPANIKNYPLEHAIRNINPFEANADANDNPCRPSDFWTESIQATFGTVLRGFLCDIYYQTIRSERPENFMSKDKQIFAFTTDIGGYKLNYSEFKSVPRHATIFAQSNNSEAVHFLNDLLLWIPAVPDIQEPQRSFSIKLIEKNDDPERHLRYLIQQMRSFDYAHKQFLDKYRLH